MSGAWFCGVVFGSAGMNALNAGLAADWGGVVWNAIPMTAAVVVDLWLGRQREVV